MQQAEQFGRARARARTYEPDHLAWIDRSVVNSMGSPGVASR
jgi:hypothetical protein